MQQKKLSSASNKISSNSDYSDENVNCAIKNEDETEEEEKCQCPDEMLPKIHRCQRTLRGARGTSAFIVYIYMWITIFSICCQGLPPVIKIGT